MAKFTALLALVIVATAGNESRFEQDDHVHLQGQFLFFCVSCKKKLFSQLMHWMNAGSARLMDLMAECAMIWLVTEWNYFKPLCPQDTDALSPSLVG